MAALLAAIAAPAATLPPGFSETLITSGLTEPTAMALAPDGRIFVAEQGGSLRVIKNGSLLTTAFVSLAVDHTAGDERGLLGVTFDPTFNASLPGDDYVYVYYTVPGSPPHNRVSRFTATILNPDVGDSELPILDLDPLSAATNHNGGAIHFGPDGKLYVAVGENANGTNSQTLANRLGKLLRINSDGTIPADNPYPEAMGPNFAIWAIGLRNPFTFAFQPGTGRMFINDVGASTWEEVNEGIARSNYGWPTTEGPTGNPAFRSPLFAYRHHTSPPEPLPPLGCAITGGTFYNPPTSRFPVDYVGDYFFSDLCDGWIHRYDSVSGANSNFATGIPNPVDLFVAPDGRMYYLARGSGSVWRITGPPTAVLAHSFRAKRSPRGVVLTWRAEPNLTVLGFNVYRNGRRLNRRLIVAGSESRYSFVDHHAPAAGARYRLQVVLADGTTTWVAHSR